MQLVRHFFLLGCICIFLQSAGRSQDPQLARNVASLRTSSDPYSQIVLEDHPVAYWKFESENNIACQECVGNTQLNLTVVGNVEFQQQGPRSPEFPLFPTSNASSYFAGKKNYLRVTDPGENSPLDFGVADQMTIEAWVFPRSIGNDQYVAVIGKGRTGNEGCETENINYCLRLKGIDGSARLNFLFRGTDGDPANPGFHRWTSHQGFPTDSGWHHIAVTYNFADVSSIRAYIDGRPVDGGWDVGGTELATPFVDNDEVRIGTSSPDHVAAFPGWIDEVALYRTMLSPERISARYLFQQDARAWPSQSDLPQDVVRVNLFANIPDRTWNFSLPESTTSFDLPSLSFTTIPNRYNSRGVRDDYALPLLAEAYVCQSLAAGDYRVLLRSKHAARLWLNGKPIAESPFLTRNGDGHEQVPDLVTPLEPNLYPLPPGHHEQVVQVELEEGLHTFRLEAIIGGKNLRPESGEICVAISYNNGPFQVLAANETKSWSLTEEHWQKFLSEESDRMLEENRKRRFEADREETAYWDSRHQAARQKLIERAGARRSEAPNSIDAMVRKIDPSILSTAIDETAFLRRVTIDTIGIVPTADELRQFVEDDSSDKRQRAIDRLLGDARWADGWVGYWQDVLAENPGIVKPEQNNTGPFRWWIYESFLDNKPMDRFATELVMMEGSRFYGGPAGFAMASQNDAPMAAKAHVLAKAFLGMEMACARCHDAPNHPFVQKELFSLAAMLKREAIELPKSSTVPINPGGRQPLITISLKAGEKLAPEWHIESFPDVEIDASVLRNAQDSRERFAALMTSPSNDRFSQVLVNRVWQRWMGWAFVEPVDDWRDQQQAISPLHCFLANELVLGDYDLKHIARLILNSSLYQAAPVTDEVAREAIRNDAIPSGPLRRRMSAEQIIDSLFAVSGKSIDVEPMSLDPESRRPPEEFLHLGTVHRAWQLASTSTDRDRPALNMPGVQQVVDVMTAFGWRDSRPAPLTVRDESASPVQSLILGNGLTSTRLARLSDDSAFTEIAMQAKSLEDLIDKLFQTCLSRLPSDLERSELSAILAEGFSTRIAKQPVTNETKPISHKRNAVSWANHLVPEATRIKLALEQEILRGDEATRYLEPQWRERMEDVVWALINCPEFLFIP